MNQTSQNGNSGLSLQEKTAADETAKPTTADSAVINNRPYVPDKPKPDASLKENAGVLLGGAGILVAILLLAFMRLSHPVRPVPKSSVFQPQKTAQPVQSTESKVPITDEGHQDAATGDQSQLSSDDIARTATKHSEPVAASLGAIQPFDNQHNWEPAAYQQTGATSDSSGADDELVEDKNEKESLEKASVVFVRNSQLSAAQKVPVNASLDLGIGLPPGTKLRARIEAAVSTAVQNPVLAVIEYNYERDGEIVVPAGAKAFGHLEAADATGYVNVRFDSLLMPDGTSIPVEAAATDLSLRPVKGKVEGKHSGKNILVRSFAGLGEITATLAGAGSLNQPLSEGTLIRERAADNIAQASDEQLTSLAVTQRIVVTVPANTEIYVVLGKPATIDGNASRSSATRVASSPGDTEQLRQLLQLQRELDQPTDAVAAKQ